MRDARHRSSGSAGDCSLYRLADVLFDLFLARHGETEWNREGRKQGHLDSPLTPSGLQHAEVQARALQGSGVTRIFSSPLGRAFDTATIMSEVLEVPVTVLDDLAEVHHGAYAGRTSEELAGEDHWAVRRDQLYTWRFPGGESYRDAEVRAARAIDRVASITEGSAAIVSHEMIGRMLVKRLGDLTPEAALSRRHPHGVIYRWRADSRDVSEYVGAR